MGDQGRQLAEERCVPCRGGIPPLTPEEYAPLLAQVPGWQVEDGRRLVRSFKFENFRQAMTFANEVAELAEAEGHHPDLYVRWGEVRVYFWTHKIGGLHENDFIMAAKVDRIYDRLRAGPAGQGPMTDSGAVLRKDFWAREGRRPRLIGREIYHFRSVGSTMDVARDLAAAAQPEGVVVRAEEQTAGRGRLGRRWVAPPGTSLLFTVLLRPAPRVVELLPMAAAVAVGRAVERVTGLRAAVKWPNDLVVSGRKFAGILVETEFVGDELAWVLLGIGVNVNWDPGAEFPELAGQATGLAREAGRPIDRERLFREILLELDRAYAKLRAGWSPFQAWRRRLITVGQRVEVVAQGQRLRGLAVGVDRTGRLRLRTDDGRLVAVGFGDVFQVQPAAAG